MRAGIRPTPSLQRGEGVCCSIDEASDATGAPNQITWFGAPASPGNLKNNGMFLPWSKTGGKEQLAVTHQGPGKPWLTLQSVAAIDLKAPFAACLAA